MPTTRERYQRFARQCLRPPPEPRCGHARCSAGVGLEILCRGMDAALSASVPSIRCPAGDRKSGPRAPTGIIDSRISRHAKLILLEMAQTWIRLAEQTKARGGPANR